MRDFAGMGGWHEEITKMHMLKRQRPDKVAGIRDFYFGEGHLNEELLHLCDLTRSFSYRITKLRDPVDELCLGPAALAGDRGQHHFRRLDRRLGGEPAG